MKAVVRERYGAPDGVRIADVAMPVPEANEVLLRVIACSVNPYDYHVALHGVPYVARLEGGITRPRTHRVGFDFAGIVEAGGTEVTRFRLGDEVYGFAAGAFAEYVCAGDTIARIPPGISFEEAAAVPTAGITALQALRDKGRLRANQKVLINGAAGGVGTFAVQIAKAFGAEVTAVCSTRNVDLVRSLGADHVIDYTRADFTLGPQRHYDLMIDNIGNRRWSEYKRLLTDDATCVLVGGPKTNRWLGPMSYWLKTRIASLRATQKVEVLIARMDPQDLQTLAEMIESRALHAVVERVVALDEVADALAAVGHGHVQGKIVMAVSRGRESQP
ncbi:MAG TPA: NAD(P)-dependent alcohol dehydrogenase [Thermoanaerobaculia bacterium]|nr:NAD(P)-dependent alcohol dehydrogenase [Thermoanaerobaculia bacterium]